MALVVKFYGARGPNTEKTLLGRIIWDGVTLRSDPETPTFRDVMAEPIMVRTPAGPKEVGPDDPVEFLGAMRGEYRGAYFWAESPEDDAQEG